ncbi:Tripartite ATP-independent transporter, DctQ component [Yoonia tamlensis]|uniref:TRAP transporter small permease protein n=1 Tax=Yoonia tamlensis TaxID=390270 RepID=A0A1I6GKD3_9RHOB|nr:TRAP transporter small permease subunit [Yoonia tamlensis]SFR42616.1 Tripartite ATP-independent transporter, DctQ component [Yoonia tamlensis]
MMIAHRVIGFCARTMALLGGIALCAVIGAVCVSVGGRALGDLAHAGYLGAAGDWLLARGLGPILGDFELVEAGTAFAVFAFLPITQLSGAHARVDVFTTGLSANTRQQMDAFWALVMLAIMLLISWRLFDGLQDKYRYGDTSYLIQFPVWWAYAACFGAAVIACCVSAYCAAVQIMGGRADAE